MVKKPAASLKKLASSGKKPPAKKIPVKKLGKGRAKASVLGSRAEVIDRLYAVIVARRTADPNVSHSARLLSRGITRVAQKFGEEAVECLIEAVAGQTDAVVAESADVLYHLLVMWVALGIDPKDVWAELERREGVSGIAEKAARLRPLVRGSHTTKIP